MIKTSLPILFVIIAFFLVQELNTPQDGNIVFYMTPLLAAMSTIILPSIYMDRDYQSGWLTMVKALPIKRSQVTGGYFLMPILFIVVGGVILTVAYFIASSGDLPVTNPLDYYFLISCVALIITSFLITFMMKFGPTLAKLMPAFIMVFSFGMPIIFTWLADAGIIDGAQVIASVKNLLDGNISSMTMIAYLVVTVLALLIGHGLSTKILNEKDF